MGRSVPLKPLDAPLTDGTIALRLRRPSDVDAIAAASHDPENRRWLHDEPMDEQAARSSMERADEAWRSGDGAPLTIADAVTDEPVGMVNLRFHDDEVALIAYSVFPARRGRGVAPRAVRLLTRWALSEAGLAELVLEADEGNAASIRVAEKTGFRRVGTRTEPGADGAEETILVFSRREP